MRQSSKDVETQLVKKLGSRKFSIQLDESSERNANDKVMAYIVSYIDNDEYRKENH